MPAHCAGRFLAVSWPDRPGKQPLPRQKETASLACWRQPGQASPALRRCAPHCTTVLAVTGSVSSVELLNDTLSNSQFGGVGALSLPAATEGRASSGGNGLDLAIQAEQTGNRGLVLTHIENC